MERKFKKEYDWTVTEQTMIHNASWNAAIEAVLVKMENPSQYPTFREFVLDIEAIKK